MSCPCQEHAVCGVQSAADRTRVRLITWGAPESERVERLEKGLAPSASWRATTPGSSANFLRNQRWLTGHQPICRCGCCAGCVSNAWRAAGLQGRKKGFGESFDGDCYPALLENHTNHSTALHCEDCASFSCLGCATLREAVRARHRESCILAVLLTSALATHDSLCDNCSPSGLPWAWVWARATCLKSFRLPRVSVSTSLFFAAFNLDGGCLTGPPGRRSRQMRAATPASVDASEISQLSSVTQQTTKQALDQLPFPT